MSHFILSGWPKWDEMVRFGREVVPRARALERYGLDRFLRDWDALLAEVAA